ncbi:hypothetical protein DRO60_04930 [Candidatus Bathyarchaeota archaeon]|nr:MAG: hypothetical protein DRO60_04930 [Candidatus Bathyarchaeota archaeon]
MKGPIRIALAAVVLLSLAVAAGVLIYVERPQPTAPVVHLRIAYTLCPIPRLIKQPFALHMKMVDEVIRAFKEWYLAHFGARVEVHVGFEEPLIFSRQVGAGPPEYDVWWGGPYDFFREKLPYLLPYNSTAKEELWNATPIVNGTYCGCPIMDLNSTTPRWYAWCFYAMCLVYDPSSLQALGVGVPENWTALADPRLENMVIAPDPIVEPFSKHVGLTILASEIWHLGNETLGWEAAWNTSVVIWAISASPLGGGAMGGGRPWEGIIEVAIGRKAAIICPDLVAYHMLIEAGYSWLHMTYLNATLLLPCPVAILDGAVNVDVAKAFVDFLLSPEGQSIVAKHVMPIRPDVRPRGLVRDPFSPDFPAIRAGKEFNWTFIWTASEFVYDYHKMWLVVNHDGSGGPKTLRGAWWWVKKAAEAAETSENATRYYQQALANLTRMRDYVRRGDFDRLYNLTDRWTNKTSYIEKWNNAAKSAYYNATESAKKAIECAEENKTAPASPLPEPAAPQSWMPARLRKPATSTGLRSEEDLSAASQSERAIRPSLPLTMGSLPSNTQLTKCSSSSLRGSRHSPASSARPLCPSSTTRWER